MALKLKGSIKNGVDTRYYMIDRQEGGRRVRLSTGTRNRDLALSREQRVIDALRADFSVPEETLRELARGAARADRIGFSTNTITLREACDRMLSGDESTRDLSLETIKFYQKNSRELCRVFGEKTPIRDITARAIEDAIRVLKAEDNAVSTINRKLITLQRVLKWAKKRGELREVPEIPKFSEAGRSRKFFYDRSLEASLLTAVLALDDEVGKHKGGHPRKPDAHLYHDFFVFLFDTGVRLRTGISVPWGQISLVAREIQIFNDSKHSKDRTLPMTQRVYDILSKLSGPDRHPIGPFAGLSAGRAQKLIQQARKRLGLEGNRQVVIHSMRHTTATRLLDSTGDIKLVQEWLGHSSVQTTANIYAHVTSSKMRKAAALLEAPDKDAAA